MIIKLSKQQKQKELINIDIVNNIKKCINECDILALSVLEDLYDIKILTDKDEKQ